MKHLKQKKTMDAILVIIGITTLIFTIAMIWIYLITGGIPDTLCTCFLSPVLENAVLWDG